MIKVFYKSDEEFEREQYGWQGKPACASYVIDKNGTHIDTDRLNEQQILSFVWQGIMQGVRAEKQQLREARTGHALDYEGPKEARELMFIVQDSYKPSLDGMTTLLGLLHHEDLLIRDFAQQTLDKTKFGTKYHDLVDTTDFWKEQRRDHHPITKEDLLATFQELQRRQARQLETVK